MAISFFELRQYLEEKTIVLGNNKPYGQVVLLAGGAGSGKGFTLSNFIQMGRGGFKVIDPDAFKTVYLKTQAKRKGEGLLHDAEILKKCNPDGIPTADKPCMKDPSTTSLLHTRLHQLNWEDKLVAGILGGTKSADLLPNIVFDRTLKSVADMLPMIYSLQQAGYQAKNIHIVWVLTNDQIALKQNLSRDRTVPPDILFHTHSGAAKNLQTLVMDAHPSKTLVDGDVWIVTGRANMVKSGKGGAYIIPPDGSPGSLRFIQVKKSGGNFIPRETVWKKIGCDICKNTPLRTEPICTDNPPC